MPRGPGRRAQHPIIARSFRPAPHGQRLEQNRLDPFSTELLKLPVYPGALTFNLLGRGTKVLKNRLGERERDLSFAGERDVRAGAVNRRRFAEIRRPHEDANVILEFARDADGFFDARHAADADNETARVVKCHS